MDLPQAVKEQFEKLVAMEKRHGSSLIGCSCLVHLRCAGKAGPEGEGEALRGLSSER